MMSWLGAILLAAGFLAVAHGLGLVAKTKTVSQIASQAMRTIGDKTVSDEVKEKELQKHSLTLMRMFFILAAGGAAAVLLPLGVVWGMEQAGWLSVNEVLATAISWEFLAITTVVAVTGSFVWRKSKSDV